MFKGLRQKIGQGFNAPSKGASTPSPTAQAPTPDRATGTVRSPSSQNVSNPDFFSDETPTVTPSGSLINLNDDPADTSLQQEQTDSLIDLSNDFSGPAVLDISGSGSNILDIKSPHSHGTRSRTSSVSSQASDSFFSPASALSSRQIPLPSDVESITSEMEDGGSVPDSVSKDELYRSYCRMQQRCSRYRWKFSQVIKAYQEIEKERDKLRETMTKSQDKAFRRISELKEQIQLDQLAKVDLEQNYLLMLEEKDELVKVLRTQISLLKQGKEVPDDIVQMTERSKKLDGGDAGGGGGSHSESVLKEKIARMSSLLLASKESISKNREFIQKLNAENARLLESLEAVKLEREQLQTATQKKDQELEVLVEKLRAENAKLCEATLQKVNGDNVLAQIERLHVNLLSEVVSARHLNRESEERLSAADAENRRLNSENKLLANEISEQKRALEKFMQSDVASKIQVDSVTLCSKHRLSSPAEDGFNEDTSVNNTQETSSCSATARVAEHGAGEFMVQGCSACIVCEKEQLLFAANEKIQKYQEKINLLEDSITQMQVEFEQRRTVVQADKLCDFDSAKAMVPEEKTHNSNIVLDGKNDDEIKCLNDKIKLLENQLNEVNTTHQLSEDSEIHHQMELENFKTSSDQIIQKLTDELEHLKDQVVCREEELLRQKEMSETAEKSLEELTAELHLQRQLYESKISVVTEENLNLASQLRAVEERHLTISTALQEVTSLKASLATSVHAIVQESVQEAVDEARNRAKNLQKACRDVVTDCEENVGDRVESDGAKESLIQSRSEEGNKLEIINSEEVNSSQVEELQNKNDSLHRVLHEWQGCVKVLKTCLEEKQKENEVLENQLQEAVRSLEILKQEREQAETESEKLRNDLKSAQIESERLQNDLQYLKIESERLRNDLKSAENECDELQNVFKSSEREIEKLQNRLKSSENEREKLENCLDSSEKQSEKLQNDLETSEGESEKLRIDLKSSEEERRKISQQLCAAEAQIEDLLQTMQDLKKLKDSEEKALKTSLRDAVDSAEKELESKIYQIKDEKDVLALQFQKLQQQSEDSIENLRSKNKGIVLEYEQMRSQQENLKRQVIELEQTNEELKKQQGVHENEMDLLQKQLDVLKQKHDRAQELEKSVNEELVRAKEHCRAIEETLEKSQSNEIVLHSRLEELHAQKILLEKKCTEQMDQVNDLERELESLKDQGSSSKNKMQKAIKVLKDKNDSLSQQVRESAEQTEHLQKLQRDLESQNDSLVIQVRDLEEIRVALQKEVQDQKLSNDSLMFQMKEFEVAKDDSSRHVLELQGQNEALSDQAKVLEEQRDSLQQQLQDLKEKYEAVSRDVRLLEEERDILREKERNMEHHSESLCVQVKVLEEKLESIVGELTELEAKNKLLQSSLEDLEVTKCSSLQEMTENENRLLEEVNALKTQVLEFTTLNRSLENQLQGLEAAKIESEQKLELALGETSLLSKAIESKEGECGEFSVIVKGLTEENGKKDLEIVALKEKLCEMDRNSKAELFSLRKQLSAILNIEVPLVMESDSDWAVELTALQRIVESELTRLVSEMKAQIEEYKLRISESEKKILELTKQIEIAEMNLNEEELAWRRKQGDIEIENEELRCHVAKLQISAKEAEDRLDDFKSECTKILSEKEKCLHEIENKLRTLCGDGSQDTMQLLEIFHKVEEKISNLSEKCAENERISNEFESASESAKKKVFKLTETLGDCEDRLRKAEANIERMACEHDAERTRLAAKIQELNDEILVLQEKKTDADNVVEESREIQKNLQEKMRIIMEENEVKTQQLKLEFGEKFQAKAEESSTLENSLAEKTLFIDQLQKDLRSVTDASSAELQTFQAKVAELEGKLALSEQNSQGAALKAAESLDDEWKEKLNRDKEMHDLEVARLKDAISVHENQREVLSKSLLELEKVKGEEIELLKSKNAELTSDILEKLEVSRVECLSKDKSIMDLNKIIEDKESTVVVLGERIVHGEQEIKTLQLAIESLEEKVQRNLYNEETIQQKQSLIDKLEENMKTEKENNESLIGVMKNENENLKQEILKSQSAIEELKNNINNLNVCVNEKIQEIATLNNSTLHFQNECSKLQAENVALIAKKEILAKDFEAKLVASCESQNEKDNQHSTELAAIETRFQEKTKELQRKFVTKLKSVQSENEKLVEEVRRENEKLLSYNAALETQLDNFKKLYDEQQGKVDELTKELKQLVGNHEEELKKYQEELAEARQKEIIKECDQKLQQSSLLESLEAELSAVKVQLEQALAGESVACLKLETAENTITELRLSIDELTMKLEESRIKSGEEMRLQAERLESECAEKLTELKKKAELRLKQIKSQVQMEKDSSVTEIIRARSDLEAELSARKEELECQLKSLQEKEDEVRRLNAELESTREECKDSAKKYEQQLSSKDRIVEELQSRCQSLDEETEQLKQTVQNQQIEGQAQVVKFSELETKFKGLKKQLVSAKHEIDRLKSENDVDVRTAQMENEKEIARLASEYKEQLKDFEIDNNSRIKQLVKDFQLKLSEKEQEFQTTYMEALEKSQREEDLMVHQHKQEVKSLRQEMREKEEAYEETIQQLEVQLQASEMHLEEEVSKSQAEIERMKLSIEQLEMQLTKQQEDLEVKGRTDEDGDHQMVKEVIEASQVKPLGASSSGTSGTSSYVNDLLEQQVIELTKQIEDLKIRYSLQVIKDQADANSDSSPARDVKSDTDRTDNEQQNEVQILELHNMELQAQVIQQCGDIARLKIHEKALQQEIQMLSSRVGRSPESPVPTDESLEQPAPTQSTELQYLRNVLLKFMTGVEQQTLARVICMVLKFSEEETQLVMEHQSEFYD